MIIEHWSKLYKITRFQIIKHIGLMLTYNIFLKRLPSLWYNSHNTKKITFNDGSNWRWRTMVQKFIDTFDRRQTATHRIQTCKGKNLNNSTQKYVCLTDILLQWKFFSAICEKLTRFRTSYLFHIHSQNESMHTLTKLLTTASPLLAHTDWRH